MQRLWAPWRMEYIEGEAPKEDGCIFCRFAAEPAERHAERLVLRVEEAVVIMMNRYPYSNAHLLVAPRAHVGALTALDDPGVGALFRGVRDTVARLEAAIEPHGFNVGANLGRAGGAGLPDHLHIHIVPRWTGDHNYLAVLAETRVINEHLQATYERLLPYFRGDDA